MTDRQLYELNNALKIRPLSGDEWEALDNHVKSKNADYIEELAAKYPMLALKYKRRNMEYKIFLSICASMINQDERFIRRGYHAEVENITYGDGANCALVIKGGYFDMPLSAIEEYTEFIKENSGPVIERFLDELLTRLI